MFRSDQGASASQTVGALFAPPPPTLETAAKKREVIERRLADAAIFALETGNTALLQFVMLEPADRKRLLGSLSGQPTPCGSLSPFLSVTAAPEPRTSSDLLNLLGRLNEPAALALFRDRLGANERERDQYLRRGNPLESGVQRLSLEELQQERGRLLLETLQCERVRIVRMAQLELVHALMGSPERKLQQDIQSELAQSALGPREKIKQTQLTALLRLSQPATREVSPTEIDLELGRLLRERLQEEERGEFANLCLASLEEEQKVRAARVILPVCSHLPLQLNQAPHRRLLLRAIEGIFIEELNLLGLKIAECYPNEPEVAAAEETTNKANHVGAGICHILKAAQGRISCNNLIAVLRDQISELDKLQLRLQEHQTHLNTLLQRIENSSAPVVEAASSAVINLEDIQLAEVKQCVEKASLLMCDEKGIPLLAHLATLKRYEEISVLLYRAPEALLAMVKLSESEFAPVLSYFPNTPEAQALLSRWYISNIAIPLEVIKTWRAQYLDPQGPLPAHAVERDVNWREYFSSDVRCTLQKAGNPNRLEREQRLVVGQTAIERLWDYPGHEATGGRHQLPDLVFWVEKLSECFKDKIARLKEGEVVTTLLSTDLVAVLNRFDRHIGAGPSRSSEPAILRVHQERKLDQAFFYLACLQLSLDFTQKKEEQRRHNEQRVVSVINHFSHTALRRPARMPGFPLTTFYGVLSLSESDGSAAPDGNSGLALIVRTFNRGDYNPGRQVARILPLFRAREAALVSHGQVTVNQLTSALEEAVGERDAAQLEAENAGARASTAETKVSTAEAKVSEESKEAAKLRDKLIETDATASAAERASSETRAMLAEINRKMDVFEKEYMSRPLEQLVAERVAKIKEQQAREEQEREAQERSQPRPPSP